MAQPKSDPPTFKDAEIAKVEAALSKFLAANWPHLLASIDDRNNDSIKFDPSWSYGDDVILNLSVVIYRYQRSFTVGIDVSTNRNGFHLTPRQRARLIACGEPYGLKERTGARFRPRNISLGNIDTD